MSRDRFLNVSERWFRLLLPLYPAHLRDEMGQALVELARVGRRFRRSPMFVAATLGTLAVGLGAFAVVYTAVDKVLIEPMPYSSPDDLYFVWRDDTAYSDGDRN